MTKKIDLKLILALAGVALIWGTTYLGIRIAVHTIPPWFVAAIRQTIASVILLLILLRKKELTWKGWPHARRQMLLSSLMIVIANGMTTVAEQTIPSGLTSLLNALTTLFVFITCVAIGLQKPSLKGFLGVIIGFLGVAFIFRSGLGALLDPNYKTGIMFLCFAITGWTIGTVYIKKNNQPSDNILLDLFYQFVFSAVAQFVLAFMFSDSRDVSLWSINSMLAVTYLAIFGSVMAFFCYHYALKKVSATEVSMLTYFNTVIALFLGWLILNEIITIDILIATVLIIIGVFITNYKSKKESL
ncbi:DMT family transporter [Pedobacter hiemivivus]|uniref:Permease n=1 Tax=Pedobacter hiemivivus TaxID=2530454 RepID=A0A4R0N7D4_9SPHI|nr:EamA family transporter [Pedobacter hiemivivus]TCC96001.1 permease [Pedobacter hiemivivus]